MALRTLVKVSEVNNLSDARYCAGMGVDLLGFDIDPTSETQISQENFHAITGWLEGIKKVGEFSSADATKIAELSTELKLNAVQIDNESIVDQLDEIDCDIFFKTTTDSDFISLREKFTPLKTKVSHFVIESDSDEHSLTVDDVEQLKKLASEFPLILGVGFSASNIGEVLDAVKPIGIALKGGDELRPGYREFDELADILEELEVD